MIYGVSLGMISGNVTRYSDGYTFHVSSVGSDIAIKAVLQANRKANHPISNEEFYKAMNDDLTWVIHDADDHYQIETDSWHTHGWQKINKETLAIYDERHKHYGRSAPEVIILYQNIPRDLFKP